jgi:hypothetical protein
LYTIAAYSGSFRTAEVGSLSTRPLTSFKHAFSPVLVSVALLQRVQSSPGTGPRKSGATRQRARSKRCNPVHFLWMCLGSGRTRHRASDRHAARDWSPIRMEITLRAVTMVALPKAAPWRQEGFARNSHSSTLSAWVRNGRKLRLSRSSRMPISALLKGRHGLVGRPPRLRVMRVSGPASGVAPHAGPLDAQTRGQHRW